MSVSVLLSNASSNTVSTSLNCASGKKAILRITGNFNADIVFEASVDGNDYFPYSGLANGGKSLTNTISAPGYVIFDVEPVSYLRAKVVRYVSGSITITGYVEGKDIGSVNISDTDISLPIDKQVIYRTQVLTMTTPLDASASYTSQSFDAITFRRITGRVYADQSGTLELQHSDDGTTWDTLTSVSVTAGTAAKFDEPIYLRYVRVRYTNGATAQTTFRLSAYLSVE